MSPADDGLDAARLLLSSAFESESESSLVTDAERRVIYCNREFTRVTGYRFEEMLGKSCAVLQGPDTDPAMVAELTSTLDAGRSFDGRILNYRSDGTTFWNHLVINPVRDSHGVLTHFVSIQRDVTDEMTG